MKIAPIMRALARHGDEIETVLVHTGQHYDIEMNSRFFEQLGIPSPDVSLEVGSGSHAVQTAEIMKRFEPVLETERPALVLVVGDVNSTIACALVAAKRGIRVAHVEAGLRSRDRRMPEEINRLLTDQLSDRLYVTEAAAIDNLLAEGIPGERVVFAGNVMIDTLLASLPDAVPAGDTLRRAGAAAAGVDPERGYALVTLHRPSNVDDPEVLSRILATLGAIAGELPVVFPMHPRTRAQVVRFGLDAFLSTPGVIVLPPQGYLEMAGLMQSAKVVLTDSGGVQEETTALGIPCLTLRENTERPITVEQGTNRLVGVDPCAIRAALDAVLAAETTASVRPELWDGHAAERIVDDLLDWMKQTL